MMRIRVGCRLVYESSWPTPAALQVQPRSEGATRVLEAKWNLEPAGATHEYLDLYGNACTRLIIPQGTQEISYDAMVEIDGLVDVAAPDSSSPPVNRSPDPYSIQATSTSCGP